ncbi:NAD-dependent epimerase/dehydratase family protein [Actinomadura madurae]|nr:NAD-dependent epimerase/dehydratase family protein [Actinomadura madurae]MCP9965612.1 NAD-dependent epimerase/dehydratase family protein [Actinomadura madurae]
MDGLVRRAAGVPDGVRPVHGDLLVPDGLPRGPYDGICHLAALTRVRESFDAPLRYFTANVQGTVNLLEAVDADRVVLGSTAAVYGTPERQPIPESEPAAPASPYGASKLAAEQAVRFHARTGAIGAVVLRTFNVAGSVDGRVDPDETRLIPKALAVAAGRAPHLDVNGDGLAVREYLHVDDLAAAYVRAVEAVAPGEDRVYNVGSGAGAAVREVVAAVEEVTGRPVPTRSRARPARGAGAGLRRHRDPYRPRLAAGPLRPAGDHRRCVERPGPRGRINSPACPSRSSKSRCCTTGS